MEPPVKNAIVAVAGALAVTAAVISALPEPSPDAVPAAAPRPASSVSAHKPTGQDSHSAPSRSAQPTASKSASPTGSKSASPTATRSASPTPSSRSTASSRTTNIPDNSIPSPSDAGGPGSAEESGIEVEQPIPAEAFQAVQITGREPGASNAVLYVQRWEDDAWTAFPLPAVSDRSGNFTTHVELSTPGRYWLRVLDSRSGATSQPFVVVITR